MNLLQQYERLNNTLTALIGEVPFDPSVNLKLERIERLLALLGNPQREFRSIHVGGTSGKGSTAALIATGLQNLGYTTGLHTSPHLQILNESALINGHMAPTTKLLNLVEKHLNPAIETMRTEEGAPSYFEALVALTFLYFAKAGVDVAVVEVGLGGRLDATNVLPAEVAVLTNVSLDHVAILGNSVAAITHEKAGIIKPNQHVILGTNEPTVLDIVTERCAAAGATLQVVSEPVLSPVSGEKLAHDIRSLNLPTAVAAVSAFVGERVADSVWAAGEGLLLPARTEIVADEPVPVVLDGAHNPAKMRVANQFLCQTFPMRGRVVVVAMKQGKAVNEVLPIMLRDARILIASQFSASELWASVPAAELARLATEIAPSVQVITEPDPHKAVARALELVQADELLWITGSLYFAGEIRERWYPKAALLAAAEEAV